MKRTNIIGNTLVTAVMAGALVGSAFAAVAGPMQEFGRDSVYAKAPIRSASMPSTANVARFGRSSLYAGDVRITPWKDPGPLPSTIAGNGRGSVYATPLSGLPEQPARVARRSQE